ncbi:hypothetical protein [Streptomyces sp. CC210A]|uniref:hypothetical protein n=1 Tax=Streptomyces sp. CC210A TaxID=2898184 RepID=UPI001F25D657|nr:hypothetical protein [Streptomyces sp. CC210A]
MITVAAPRHLTLVVRWEASTEGVSYDLPSMICTVPVPTDLAEASALDLARRITAERVTTAYPHGPEGDEPIHASWVFEDDALCLIEAVFEGEPTLIDAWAHSTVI